MIETERLLLRGWRDDDFDHWFAMCSDMRVMATIGPLRTEDEARETIHTQQTIQADMGYCFWAIERKSDGRMIGFCGLEDGPDATPIASRIEIGWRLAFDCWRQGYAREAALAALGWGFDNQAFDRIWAITSRVNDRSWGLMERLGMMRHFDLDFDHPNVPFGSPLKPHITYSIARRN